MPFYYIISTICSIRIFQKTINCKASHRTIPLNYYPLYQNFLENYYLYNITHTILLCIFIICSIRIFQKIINRKALHRIILLNYIHYLFYRNISENY